jgi:hypothetical protein
VDKPIKLASQFSCDTGAATLRCVESFESSTEQIQNSLGSKLLTILIVGTACQGICNGPVAAPVVIRRCSSGVPSSLNRPSSSSSSHGPSAARDDAVGSRRGTGGQRPSESDATGRPKARGPSRRRQRDLDRLGDDSAVCVRARPAALTRPLAPHARSPLKHSRRAAAGTAGLEPQPLGRKGRNRKAKTTAYWPLAAVPAAVGTPENRRNLHLHGLRPIGVVPTRLRSFSSDVKVWLTAWHKIVKVQ